MAKKKTPPKANPTSNSPIREGDPFQSGQRLHWFDEDTQTPLIDQYARRLESFIETMADGIVETHELEAQETRVIDLMKSIESQLDDALHEKVTRLLCELTAYDLMQIVFLMQTERPKTVFRG